MQYGSIIIKIESSEELLLMEQAGGDFDTPNGQE